MKLCIYHFRCLKYIYIEAEIFYIILWLFFPLLKIATLYISKIALSKIQNNLKEQDVVKRHIINVLLLTLEMSSVPYYI